MLPFLLNPLSFRAHSVTCTNGFQYIIGPERGQCKVGCASLQTANWGPVQKFAALGTVQPRIHTARYAMSHSPSSAVHPTQKNNNSMWYTALREEAPEPGMISSDHFIRIQHFGGLNQQPIQRLHKAIPRG